MSSIKPEYYANIQFLAYKPTKIHKIALLYYNRKVNIA